MSTGTAALTRSRGCPRFSRAAPPGFRVSRLVLPGERLRACQVPTRIVSESSCYITQVIMLLLRLSSSISRTRKAAQRDYTGPIGLSSNCRSRVWVTVPPPVTTVSGPGPRKYCLSHLHFLPCQEKKRCTGCRSIRSWRRRRHAWWCRSGGCDSFSGVIKKEKNQQQGTCCAWQRNNIYARPGPGIACADQDQRRWYWKIVQRQTYLEQGIHTVHTHHPWQDLAHWKD